MLQTEYAFTLPKGYVDGEGTLHREGGVNDFEHTFVGPTKSGPLVLKRGLTLVDSMWLWFQETMRGNILRKNGTIYLLNKIATLSTGKSPVFRLHPGRTSTSMLPFFGSMRRPSFSSASV